MIDALLQKQFLPILKDKGIIDEAGIKKILREAETRKISLTTALSEEKCVEDSEIEEFFADELGVTVVDPLEEDVTDDILNLVDKDTAEKYNAIPVAFDDGILSVAVINPMDIILVDDLRAVLGCAVRPVLALPHKLSLAFKKYYEKEDIDESDDLEEIMAEAAADDVEVVETEADFGVSDLGENEDDTPIIKVTNLILMEGIRRQASDIFVEPWEKNMSVRCRVDGLLEEMTSPPKSMASSIVSRIKVMSNLDIAERRMPQDGRFKIKYKRRFVDFRVNVLPSSFGEKVCLRILDKTNQAQSLDKLGFAPLELKRMRDAAAKPHGMILVTGPTGSGKTTTLYSVLEEIDSPEKNITTVEDPVEYQVYGINQVNINDNVGLTFSAALRSILRQDPDVVMVGEIRDFTTMDIAIKAALTGHLVLSTLHTNDACGSIVRITNMGIEPFLIASSVLMVSAQRLIRRLCPDCKSPYKPDASVFATVGREPEDNIEFFTAEGCETCRGTGYKGRTVITEVLPLSPAVKDLIMKKANAEEIKLLARKEGMRTLRESGVEKVYKGETSVEEVLRVTAPDAAMPQGEGGADEE